MGEIRGSSFFHAFKIFAGTGVDTDFVSFFDEIGDDKFRAGIDLCVFCDVGSGISTDGGVGLNDFENDVIRRRDTDRIVIVEHDVAFHFFFQILPVVVDKLGGKLVLLVRFGAHENIVFAVSIKILRLNFSNIGGFDRVAAFPGAFQDGAAKEIAQLAFVEGLTFARFHELAFDHDKGVAFELDFQTLAEFAGIDTDHVSVPSCLNKIAFWPIKGKDFSEKPPLSRETRLSTVLEIKFPN